MDPALGRRDFVQPGGITNTQAKRGVLAERFVKDSASPLQIEMVDLDLAVAIEFLSERIAHRTPDLTTCPCADKIVVPDKTGNGAEPFLAIDNPMGQLRVIDEPVEIGRVPHELRQLESPRIFAVAVDHDLLELDVEHLVRRPGYPPAIPLLPPERFSNLGRDRLVGGWLCRAHIPHNWQRRGGTRIRQKVAYIAHSNLVTCEITFVKCLLGHQTYETQCPVITN